LVDGVGIINFDGAGNLTQQDFVIRNGTEVPGGPPNPSGFHTGETGAYNVYSDCTGSANIVLAPGNQRDLALVISTVGHAVNAVVTSALANGSPTLLQIYSDFNRVSRH
jgi:hypothetical protein